MSTNRSGGGPDDGEMGSWASEALPRSIRKELLERELAKLGFRKRGTPGGAAHPGGTAQQQQQPQGSAHPEAASGSEDRPSE